MGAEKRDPGRDEPARGNDSGWLKWFPIARWVVVGVFFAVIAWVNIDRNASAIVIVSAAIAEEEEDRKEADVAIRREETAARTVQWEAIREQAKTINLQVTAGAAIGQALKDMNARLGRIEGKLDRRDVGYR